MIVLLLKLFEVGNNLVMIFINYSDDFHSPPEIGCFHPLVMNDSHALEIGFPNPCNCSDLRCCTPGFCLQWLNCVVSWLVGWCQGATQGL